MAEDHDDDQARIARLDTMIDRAKSLPSLPEMASQIRDLMRTVAALTTRVEALERECEALRSEALIRFWEQSD
jgi:outer membrane murein-binding lipoprotein Lpp